MVRTVRRRVTGLLTSGAVALAFLCLRFTRSVVVEMLERGGSAEAELSSLSTFALAITRPAPLMILLVVGLGAAALSESVVPTEAGRLLVQGAVLLLLVLVLVVALTGFLIPFHIPDVHLE